MSISFWCVLVAGLLPLLGTAAAKWGFQNFDNNNPRAWLANQTGFRARGNAAQANSFEAFPFFAAGVIIANLMHASEGAINSLAIAFILARLAFILCYVMDKSALRSLMWSIGIFCTIGLFIIAGYYH
jgi:uncharacterized MAPEG superfamily protein